MFFIMFNYIMNVYLTLLKTSWTASKNIKQDVVMAAIIQQQQLVPPYVSQLSHDYIYI